MPGLRRRTPQRLLLSVLLVAGLFAAAPARAQTHDQPHALRWWEPIAVGAGVATLFLVDEPVREFMVDRRGATRDDVADFAANFKNPEIVYTAGLGAVALGLVADRPVVARTGVQILTGYAVDGLIMSGLKRLFSRSRPKDTPGDATSFDLFGGDSESALPSGSAMVVFNLATLVSDAVDRRPVTVLLFSAAGLNAWSRVYQNKHWLSDVALGAVLGVSTARLINGRWTIAGLRLPTATPTRDGLRLGYTVRF